MNRYNIGVVCAKDVTPTWAARKSPTGKFVLYEDHAAEVRALRKEVERLQGELVEERNVIERIWGGIKHVGGRVLEKRISWAIPIAQKLRSKEGKSA